MPFNQIPPVMAQNDSANAHQAILEPIGKFVESLYDVDSPFEFASTLVKATAPHYNADIATLFRVSPSKTELVAEAGYDQKGELLQAKASYTLPWSARSEADMPGGGLTAWVAVNGQPLFIPNADELLDQTKHPAHRGAWDTELHPSGPHQTFGCLYAVPLRVGQKNPVDSVMGVYKIERRKANQHGVFTQQEISEFDLLARQFTLVITLYERAMLRILSDARHAVAGRLADTITQLDAAAYYLAVRDPSKREVALENATRVIDRSKDDARRVSSWLRQALETYSHPLEREKRSLSEFLSDTLAATGAQQSPTQLNVSAAHDQELQLQVSESWDLHTVLLSLLNNALQHSGRPETVTLASRIDQTDPHEGHHAQPEIVFNVEDRGNGLPPDKIQQAKRFVESGTLDFVTQPRGTGLPRVYRVCKFRHWSIRDYSLQPGAGFEIRVPIRDAKQ